MDILLFSKKNNNKVDNQIYIYFFLFLFPDNYNFLFLFFFQQTSTVTLLVQTLFSLFCSTNFYSVWFKLYFFSSFFTSPFEFVSILLLESNTIEIKLKDKK